METRKPAARPRSEDAAVDRRLTQSIPGWRLAARRGVQSIAALRRWGIVFGLVLALLSPRLQAQSGTVEEIRVQGLFRMTEEAFLHALDVRVGDPYDEARLRGRFRYLWDLGLFQDISIEAETAPRGGKALIVKIKERPVLNSVTYEDTKVASRTQIEDRLKERKLSLKLGKPLDMGAIFFVETAIRDLMGERGYLDAKVQSEVRKVTETSRSVHFRITAGGKTRIRTIAFQGNTVHSDRKLRSALQITQPRKWYWPWSQKNLYHPLKWEQDVSNLRELYQNDGYLDVEFRPPVVEVRRKNSDEATLLTQSEERPPFPTEGDSDAGSADADSETDEGQQEKKGQARANRKQRLRNNQAAREALKAETRAAKQRKKAGITEVVSTDPEDGTIDDGAAAEPSTPPTKAELKLQKKREQLQRKIDKQVARIAALETDEQLTRKQRRKRSRKKADQEAKLSKLNGKLEKLEIKQERGWVELLVQVKEGKQYELGEVTITGNDKFETVLLRALLPVRSGDVLRNNFLDGGVDNIRRLYENRGHLYATVVRRINRLEDSNIADVEIIVDEDSPYYVGRINFSGNSSTFDRVLRRELLLKEGELYSRDRIEVSKIKVNQLGYWQVNGEPRVEPIEDENRVRVTFEGEERGRNEIQVGGGYSGFDGAFFNGVYSTRNFLGRGQVLSTSIQVGGQSSRYQISFQEPWFLNRPILAGFSLFRRDVDFGRSLRSDSTGFGVNLGRRLGRFSQVAIGYNFQSVSSTTVLTSTDVDGLDSITNENDISGVTPIFTFSSINNPFRPSRGKRLQISSQVAGGPLGGNTAFIKPILQFTGYRKAFGSRFFALHAQLGLVREFADGTTSNTSTIEGVPRFERFWLGGDTFGPRIFETRTITPRRFVVLNDDNQIVDILGDPRDVAADDLVTSGGIPVLIEIGGDRFFLIQSELVWPLNEQAELALFVDAGDALFDDQSLGFDTTRVAAGVELRFHLPIFPVPLRLIWGVPVRQIEGDQTQNFTFSIGRSF